jgi:MFS family permease
VPYYGVGVFVPIAVMGLAIREHVRKRVTDPRARRWGLLGTTIAVALAVVIFTGQIITKWAEGGWVVLIVFTILILAAHILLISPAGFRDPADIHRIIREKSRVQGSTGNIVEWQSLRMQEYRYKLLVGVVRFFALLGIMKPLTLEQQTTPVPAGEFEQAMEHSGTKTFLEQYMERQPRPAPKVGGAPRETEAGEDSEE